MYPTHLCIVLVYVINTLNDGNFVCHMQDAILQLDGTLLDADRLENILKFCPTKEEMEQLKVNPLLIRPSNSVLYIHSIVGYKCCSLSQFSHLRIDRVHCDNSISIIKVTRICLASAKRSVSRSYAFLF